MNSAVGVYPLILGLLGLVAAPHLVRFQLTAIGAADGQFARILTMLYRVVAGAAVLFGLLALTGVLSPT